jgi:outer membrane receptor protein involved in Fe transport
MRARISKASIPFLKKRNKKLLSHSSATALQKFFASFFQKRRPCFFLTMLIIPQVALAETPASKKRVVEQVIVHARAIPGGGLITPQDAPVSRSTVSAAAIARQAPTSNAFELLRLAPGANTSTSDPYGLSPSVNISVRGLNGDEVAYLVEGAPVNDIGYYAGYPSQWVDAENIKSVSLQQGTSDLDTPTISGGGGLITLDLRDPSETAGGYAAGTYGSYHANREFLRLDSGPIAGTNARGFVSYSDTAADNYRGPGRDHRQHVDFKLVNAWGDGNRIAIAGSYHDATLSGYPMPTLAEWSAYGRSNNYDATFSPGDTNYWKLYQQTWHDEQVSIPTHLTLSDTLSFETTPYFEHGFGNTPYGAILPTTGLYLGTQPITQPVTIPGAQNGQALVLADYIGNQYRAGVTSKLIATIGPNRIVAGWWYDYADDDDPQPFTPVSATGEPASIWGFPYTIKLPDGRTLSAQEAHTREQANVLFIGDTLNLLAGRLQIDAGLKYAMVNRNGTNSLPGPQYRVGLNSAQPLPRASLRYHLTPQTQLFASVSTNFRSATEYALYNTYDIVGDQLSRGSAQRDEYSISEEAGIRIQTPTLDASLAAFNYNFTNRQISTLINGVIGTSINAGGQTSRGIDAEIGFLAAPRWRPYVSAEYLHATTDNNLLLAGQLYQTAGKTAVRSPAFQGAIGIDYDAASIFANLAIKYTGSQYATFVNDERIPSHAQADATIGLRLPPWAFIKSPEARLNLINLTDAKFLSGIASVQPDAKSGAPTYYIGTGFAAVVTVVSSF